MKEMTKDEIIAAIAMLNDNGTLRRIADVLNHRDSTTERVCTKTLTRREAAQRLGISRTSLWRCIKAGQIRETGKMHRIPLSEIINFAAPIDRFPSHTLS